MANRFGDDPVEQPKVAKANRFGDTPASATFDPAAPVPGMEKLSATGQPPVPGFHTTPGWGHSQSLEQPTAIPLPKALQPDPNASDIVKGGFNKLGNLAPTFAGENGIRRGLSDAIEGTAAAAIPFVAPEALATPAAVGKTALMLGGAYVGQKGGEMASDALGADPETSRLVGNLTGAAAGGLSSKIPGGLKALRTADPRIAVTRSLRPTPSDPGFSDRIPQTIGAIKAANPGITPAVEEGELNLVRAANKAIAAHQEALGSWMDRTAGQKVSGQPIVDATANATRSMLPSEQGSAQALIERANQDYGNDFTAQELRERLTLLNKRLASFYNGAPGKQSAALADIPEAVLKAQRDAVADTLYRHLDPEGGGAGPREIQSRTGDLIDFRDAALRRNNAIVAEQPLTPLGRIVDPVKGLVRHFMPGNTGAGLAFAEGSEGRSIPMLKKAFSAVGDTEGSNDLGMLPRPGPRSIAAPPDLSGPVPGAGDFASVGSDRAPKIRLLPPASSGIGVSGTTVPDVIGRSSRGVGSPQPLLPPPQPGQPPINILPRGPGSIGPAGSVPINSTEAPIPAKGELGGRMTDILRAHRGENLVPVKNPKTGKIEYVPDWMAGYNLAMSPAINPDTPYPAELKIP